MRPCPYRTASKSVATKERLLNRTERYKQGIKSVAGKAVSIEAIETSDLS